MRGGAVVHGGSSYYHAYPYYAHPYYARPYYAFRPHVNLGFGLWLGYPYGYPAPYAYAQPYAAPYPYAVPPSYGAPSYPPSNDGSYGDPPSNDGSSGYPPSYEPSGQRYPAQQSSPSMGVQRAQSATGGLSFDITPDNATVFVDGTYVGTAAAFGPQSQPLDLSSGRHRVEVRASGFHTMTFDADVRPGQVLPYQGTLQRN